MKRVVLNLLPLTLTLALAATAAGAAAPAAPGDLADPQGEPGVGPMFGPGHGGPPGMGGHHGPGGPPFERDLFPPDLVLHNQTALGLSDEQISAIKKLLNEMHPRILDLQTNLDRVTERLGGILKSSRIDETAALSAADEAMGLETQIKKTHLTLLVRLKNLLTEEQQIKLRDLRASLPRP